MTCFSGKAYVVVLFIAWGVICISAMAGEVNRQEPNYKIQNIIIEPHSIIPTIQANPGEVTLHWTAPGDDRNVGMAHHYLIKYSTSNINEANWNSITVAPNPPTPLTAGSPQSYAIAGLNRGAIYYFAIKTYDEANNVSSLSNISRHFAGGIMTPSPKWDIVDSINVSATLQADTVAAAMRLLYQFAFDTSATFRTPSFAVDSLIDSVAAVTVSSLRRNTTYYWHVRAIFTDRTDTSLWSTNDSFFMPDTAINDIPRVTVTAPNGTQMLEVGGNFNITWTDSDNNGISAYKAEYTSDGGTSWVTIRDWTSGDPHVLAWTIPNALSSLCRIRISARDSRGLAGSDISDNYFTIRDTTLPTVTVTAPNGRETWNAGISYSIIWTDRDNAGVASYKLEYSTNRGSSWILIRDWTSGDPHNYAWTPPYITSNACRMRVSCRDASGNLRNDISNRNFTIRFSGILYGNGHNVPDNEPSISDLGVGDGANRDTLPLLQPSDQIIGVIPEEFSLSPAYPNPFNAYTTIEYGLPSEAYVTIDIYDLSGRLITNLVSEYQSTGFHKVSWHAAGQSSGIYLYRIKAGPFVDTKKMTVLK
jgi:hypothetical protein